MRHRCLVLIIFLALSVQYGGTQTQSNETQGQNQESQAKIASPEISPETPVITLNGLCDSGLVTSSIPPSAAPPDKALDPNCKTVITREQWEKLLGGVGLQPKAYRVRGNADQIIRTLMMASNGRALGVEKDPRFQEKVRFSYIQDLDQWGVVRMQEIANDISEADAQSYYKEHPERFWRSHIVQIAVPKRKDPGAPPPKTAAAKAAAKADPSGEASLHRLALRIQKRAAAGEDPDKLEELAYQVAGNASVPETDLGMQVPDQIPLTYRQLIFDLNPGQVSQVTENDHEYLIFKCVEKHKIESSEVREFMGFLRMRDARRLLMDSVKTETNDTYFSVKPSDLQDDSAPGIASQK